MKSNMTIKDWADVVEKLTTNPALHQMVSLQKKLTRIAHEELGIGERYPIAIRCNGDSLTCKVDPWVCFKLEHLVFPEDVARAYELTSLEINNVHCQGAPGNLPLEVFSIKNYAKQTPDKLLDVMKWNVPRVTPGQRLHFHFNPIVSNPPPIRGIGWVLIL